MDQRLVILLLLVGAGLAPITGFLSLPVAVGGAGLLFLRAPERLTCYRCRARIRGHVPSGEHGPYDARLSARLDREIAERSRRPRDSVAPGDRTAGGE
jgi:hypothetical protein